MVLHEELFLITDSNVLAHPIAIEHPVQDQYNTIFRPDQEPITLK